MAKTVSDLTHTGQVNSFTGGLNTDLHPLVQPNDTLTDCINGTLITYNGNENMLQNDMGNYALEGSELPDGFIPLGMKEHNGVAYIVSHNPNTKEVQIGSYPSPEVTVTDKDLQTLESNPIPMTIIANATPYPTDYSYDNCVKYWCVESRKVPETQYTEFDIELNFGDEYAISPMEGNLDFQYEQFAIKEESGKITNINPITDGEMNTVNWTSCGQLLKKYVLNKVTKFTQDVDWQVFEGQKTRIVGGLPEDNHIYPNEDFQSITIKNTVKFDRVDVVREDNDEVLVGVLHKVITGNPKAFANDSDRKPLESYTKVHNILETKSFDGHTEYEFTTNISSNGFLYFIRKWLELEGNKIVNSADSNINPIEIQSYPILIHRVNGKDKSVLLYDESGKQTSISELDVKGDFIYQYYCESGEDLTKVYLKLDGLDTNKGFKANLLYLHENGSLLTTNELYDKRPSNLIFEYNNKTGYWEGLLKTTDSVLFFEANVLNSHYIFPLFTSVDFEAYEQFSSLYDNFCLIPGDKLLDISASGENIEIGDTKTSKYVKLTDTLKIHDEPFYTSVYYYDNNNTYYGDVECGDITINNYSGTRAVLELQKQNEDGSWTTIDKKTQSVTNGTTTFKDCIVSANIQKVLEGDVVNKCLERVYLAKMGHAPFAHSEDENSRKKTDWYERFHNNTGFNEKLFEKLVKYGAWTVNKKSLRVGKHCGKHNNEFVVNTCDIYGNVDTEKSPRTHATTEGWKTEFDNNQLFVPVTFNVNCKTAGISTWLFHRINDDHSTMSYESYRCPVSTTLFTTTLARTSTAPFVVADTNLAFSSVDKSEAKSPNYTLFDKWLLYLYTHAFYYDELHTSAQAILLIKNNAKAEKLQCVIKGSFIKSPIINGETFTFNNSNKSLLLSQLKLRCKNFEFYLANVDNPVINIDLTSTNILWNEIDNIVNSIKYDNSLDVDYSSLYCDVYNNEWSTVKWGVEVNDINYNGLLKLIPGININDWYLNVTGNFPIIEAFGKRSNGVNLASMHISKSERILDGIKLGKLKRILKDVLANPIQREMEGMTFINEPNVSASAYELTHDYALQVPTDYDFSPRFKQIINYGTDD